MISDPLELQELRQTTQDLISENRVSIALTRYSWERTPAGGMRRVNPVTLDPVDRYFGAIRPDSRVSIVSEGERVETEYVLIGMPGDDIQQKDTFKYGGQEFRVVEVHPDRTYEVRAWVVGVT